MHIAVIEYLASEVIADLRARRPLDGQVARELTSYPTIDFIRPLVDDDDTPWIMRLTDSETEGVRFLAFSLLKKAQRTPEMRAFFHGLWQKRTDFFTRNTIMWNILDDPELDNAFHADIYQFVRDHWDQYLRGQIEFMGAASGADGVLDAARARLGDPVFPRTKDWAYLCSVLASPDKEGARTLLIRYLESTDSIVADVVRDMLAMLD